jgi:S1-C subfamily serine protease
MKGNFSGVYVAEVGRGSAADKAGVYEGDILVAINGKKVKSPSDVQAAVNAYKPEDVVKLLVFRAGKEIELEAVLGSAQQDIAQASEDNPVIYGATLGEPDAALLKKLRLRGGVEVKELEKGKFKEAGVQKGLIITHINQMPVSSVKEALEVIGKTKRGFLVEGVYRNGDVYYYGVGV